MIRLMGLVPGIKAIGNKPVGGIKEELTDKQKQLDVDKDGEIEGSDLAALRKKDEGAEGQDHEVSMANNALDDIIKNATELKSKMGEGEKEIPAWIQDHVSQAQNFISQANTNYHEYGQQEQPAAAAPDAGAM